MTLSNQTSIKRVDELFQIAALTNLVENVNREECVTGTDFLKIPALHEFCLNEICQSNRPYLLSVFETFLRVDCLLTLP